MKAASFEMLLLLMLSVLLAVGCGSARRGIPLVGDREPGDPQVVQGRQVFDSVCHQCHPGGAGGLGPALNDKPLPGWAIRFQVRHGLGAMPAFDEEVISDEELDAIVAYMKWLRRLPED